MLDEFIAGLASGEINLFTGPLNFQDGSVYLADGEDGHRPPDLVHDPAARGHRRGVQRPSDSKLFGSGRLTADRSVRRPPRSMADRR